VSRRALAQRVAALEKAAAPPPKVRWSPWQRVLTDAEDQLLVALAARGAGPKGETGAELEDDPPAWTDLCADEGERLLLATVLAKARDPVFPPPWDRVSYPLYLYLMELQL
jgi:hypothetical protein